jgi:ketosteroid isomerase-like protein
MDRALICVQLRGHRLNLSFFVIMRNPLIFLLFCTACAARFGTADADAIRTVMADQELAWDRGDISGFMQGYSDTVCFIGSRGITCGREAVTANYLRNYPDQAAMGDLTFALQEVVPAGHDNAWVTGTWNLVRAADTLGGGFSLLWSREHDGWRIVRDHTY